MARFSRSFTSPDPLQPLPGENDRWHRSHQKWMLGSRRATRLPIDWISGPSTFPIDRLRIRPHRPHKGSRHRLVEGNDLNNGVQGPRYASAPFPSDANSNKYPSAAARFRSSSEWVVIMN